MTHQTRIHGTFPATVVGEKDGWTLVETTNPFTGKKVTVPVNPSSVTPA